MKPWLARAVRSRSVLSLVLGLGFLGLLAAVLWREGARATAGLFQSDLPTPAEWATSTPTEVPTLPLATATSPVTGTLPTVSASPSATEALPATATELPQATPEVTIEEPALPEPTPQPASEATPALGSDEGSRYPDERAGIRFNWRALADSLALAVSYLWLACGIALLVLLTVTLIWLSLRGRRSRER